MQQHCQIPNIIEKIYSGWSCTVGYMGGSVTLATGASNTAETSWRSLFQKYLYKEYHRKYYCRVGEVCSGLGSCPSSIGAFLVRRNLLLAKPDLVFIEFCLNDRHVLDKTLVAKGMEGVIRQLLMAKSRCDVILLGAGCNPEGSIPPGYAGPIDHSLHRRIAQHYDLPFFDMQSYVYNKLEERGETWATHIVNKVDNDPFYHLNDYGQSLYFEAIREGFEQQIASYEHSGRNGYKVSIPDPLVSDELQFTKLIDPAIENDSLTLEGAWEKRPDDLVPWSCDSLMMGRPGARMSLAFNGTAVMVWALMHNNGLKLEAVLDGQEMAGPYLKYHIEFCRGFLLAHGLPQGQHLLELTVSKPTKRHYKLPDPTAQIGYLGIACR